MSRYSSAHSKPRKKCPKLPRPSRTTILAAAGTTATAGVAAAVIAAGPALFASPSSAGQAQDTQALALDVGRGGVSAAEQANAANQDSGQPSNPALVARAALGEQYAQAVQARRRAARRAAVRRAAEQAARLAAARRRQAARHAAAQQQSAAPSTPSGTPQQIAMGMLPSFGWSSSQFSCLNSLWQRESGWNPYASNASGAYGIPQALPGSKMASAGPDWQSNAATQIRWGLGYIRATYGSPCAAWSHENSTGWY